MIKPKKELYNKKGGPVQHLEGIYPLTVTQQKTTEYKALTTCEMEM